MNALLLINLQNDYMSGGALAVAHAEALVTLANQIQTKFKLVVATQSWHPPNHAGFAANHPGRKSGDMVIVKKHEQRLWPTHCLQGSRGAELAPGFVRTRLHKIFKTGTDAEHNTYSAFFDGRTERATGLGEYLKEKKVTDIYLAGLPLEYDVKFTALDAVMLGYTTFLVEDACRGLNEKPDAVANALEQMRQAGVKSVRSRELKEGL